MISSFLCPYMCVYSGARLIVPLFTHPLTGVAGRKTLFGDQISQLETGRKLKLFIFGTFFFTEKDERDKTDSLRQHDLFFPFTVCDGKKRSRQIAKHNGFSTGVCNKFGFYCKKVT